MTARHAPKHCFQPTKLKGVITQNITMQNPEFITSCCHNKLQPFSSLAIRSSLNKQKLAKWEQQGVSRKQQGADINCYTSLCECFVGLWATVLLSVALWVFSWPVSHSSTVRCTVSVQSACEPQFYCLLHCSSKLLSSSANRVVKMENTGQWQSCQYNSVKYVCVCVCA